MRRGTHNKIVANFENIIDQKDKQIDSLQKEIKANQKVINKLLAKLMSRNWEQFYHTELIQANEEVTTSDEYHPEEDDNNAGEIINIPQGK